MLARCLKYLCLASKRVVQWWTSGPNLCIKRLISITMYTYDFHSYITYSRMSLGMWIIECIFKVIDTPGYRSLKDKWWSLIRVSKYPTSSFGMRLENKMSVISKRSRKLSQCSSPSGIMWPIAKGRNLPSVHICIAIIICMLTTTIIQCSSSVEPPIKDLFTVL